MRQHNLELLLRLIWDEGEISRASLARRTQLSRSTVSEIVAVFLEQGLVEEAKVARSRGGRPPILLRIRAQAAVVIGVELATTLITVVVRDLRGAAIASRTIAHDVEHDPQGTLLLLDQQLDGVLGDAGLPQSRVIGIGVAVPCPLRPDRPDELSPRILPAWVDVRLAAALHARTGRPVFLDNDANLGALAEHWFGGCRDGEDFAFIKLAAGVGAGLFIDGEIYRGATGIAGEIGHTAIDPNGPICRCGLPGCLEALIGTPALLASSSALDIEGLVAATLDGDPDAPSLIAQAGSHLGVAIANLVNLLNPRVVVLHGPLTAAGVVLTDPLMERLRSRALWTSIVDVEVRISPLGPDAVARGAAALVLQAALKNPTLITAAIEQPTPSPSLEATR